jgi:hypothetical protein
MALVTLPTTALKNLIPNTNLDVRGFLEGGDCRSCNGNDASEEMRRVIDDLKEGETNNKN